MDLTIFILALAVLAMIVAFFMWKCYHWGFDDGYNAGYDFGAREVENFYQRRPRQFSQRIMEAMTRPEYP